MIHSRSYTSATPNNSPPVSTYATSPYATSPTSIDRWGIVWCAIFFLGVVLRLMRLAWQPLWWDEGYSIYFATEPIPTMLSLTARDIHPPLYYALLHIWLALTNSTDPVAARLLSALFGIATLPVMTWAARTLFPAQRWLPLIATFLLAINPMHLFYSQEVRMYGLALLLTLCASTFLWRMQQELAEGGKPFNATAGYIITAALALLTLDYTGFLLVAHQLWALFVFRKEWRKCRWFFAAALLILLIQLPWWLYALPKLFYYVGDKVVADQDSPLPLWSYLWRHWLAFVAGHIPAAMPWVEIARQLIAALLPLPFLYWFIITRRKPGQPRVRWLLCLVLIPVIIGFVVNLYLPFFPEGGERLLLQVLPYLILLLSFIIGTLYTSSPGIAAISLALPLLGAVIGSTIFFTTPRYVEHDYRPVIDYVATHSRANDTILALFPWQVGYWRAYSPRTPDGAPLSPQPAAVDQQILEWDESFAARLDRELMSGTIWFPMPLSFGSTLPGEIEEYLKVRARNLENKWFSPATLLTAWVNLEDTPEQFSLEAEYTDLVLASGGVAPSTLSSANTPLAVDLCWHPPAQRQDLRATLRLLDATGYTWAQRDLNPLANYSSINPADPCRESIAFIVPVGLPPGTYQLAVGVGPDESDQLFTPMAVGPTSAASSLLPIGQVVITAPTETLPPQRLPIEHRLRPSLEEEGLRLLGYSGPDQDASFLAGDEVALTLALQNSNDQPAARNIYISLLDRQGNGLAGKEVWPLPDYPTHIWKKGALTQVPIHFYLPPDLAGGRYTLAAGFLDPATGEKTSPAILARVEVVRRPSTFTLPTSQTPITPPVQFGTHAHLIGYSAAQEGDTLNLTLDWKVIQPLLPPHHIFVHLFDASGQRIVQFDGEPVNASGRAPTSSWLPDEYLTTQHTLILPAGTKGPVSVQVGLYLPATGERLLATVEGAPTGNSATLMLQIEP